jgi:hypothetical protein
MMDLRIPFHQDDIPFASFTDMLIRSLERIAANFRTKERECRDIEWIYRRKLEVVDLARLGKKFKDWKKARYELRHPALSEYFDTIKALEERVELAR